jgi:cytochrome c-type biogenesis protein CcmH
MGPNRSPDSAAQRDPSVSWALLGAAIVLPAVLFGLVSYWGAAPTAAPSTPPAPAAAQKAPAPGPNAALEALRKQVQANPEDAARWALLARHYYRAGRFTDALPAFEKAVALSPKDAELLADYADTLATVEGKRLTGRPAELIQQALALDPDNIKALWLAGTGAFQSQDYEGAIQPWQRLKGLLPEGSKDAATMATNIEQARSLGAQGEGVLLRNSRDPPHPGPPPSRGRES